MEAIGNNQFSAKPQVVQNRSGPYRDPYREYIKVAPQNIMYDRRVVRGNTFAALVIPVNMQPDPALIEKQKQEQMMRRQRLEQISKRKEDESRRQKYVEEEQQRKQFVDLQNQNPWDELSDFDNMVDENQLEPDYYIDKPPSPVFVPQHEGDIKKIQVNEIDQDLFDFELECEPILQVLVGKAIEEAQILAIEDHESKELQKHKKTFLQLKEAELMETQRVEAARKRRIEENERRNLQQRTAKNQRIWEERKVVARHMAKDFFSLFKRDILQTMIDQGILRRPYEYSKYSQLVPQLYGQIVQDLQIYKEHQENMDSLLNYCLRGQSKQHRDSMIKEYKRREENKKQQILRQKEIEEQKRQRKEERAAARERHRLQQLLDKVQNTILANCSYEDYNPQIKIYDVRDPNGKKDGIFLIGGLMGELIITFTCLNDYILANPQNQNFMFTTDSIEAFLKDFLLHENFAEGILTLHLVRDPTIKQEEGQEEEILDIDDDTFMRFALTKNNITDYGLGFLFDLIKDLQISRDFIETLYRVIIKIARTKLKPIQQVPEIEGQEEISEEEKVQLQKKIDEINKQNAEAEKINEEIMKIQSKIKINYREHIENSERNECGLMRVNNYREPKVEENMMDSSQIQQEQQNISKQSQKVEDKSKSQGQMSGREISDDKSDNVGTFDNFAIEDVPSKIILVDPSTSEDNLIVYHSEAQYALRKLIIDVVKKHFKELDKLHVNSVLGYTAQKSKTLDERFEDHIIKTLKFGRGSQFNDKNLKITWKTFLQT